jgi:TolA-binding protein
MTDDLLRDLAKDLPFERPTAARRDALRSSLLVEAAESTTHPVAPRRWPIVVGFAAGALAAAAIAVLVIQRPAPVIERANLAQVMASSSDVRIDHQIVATEHGSDEIVRIREGTIALAIPAQRRGDRMVVRTTTADVEGEAGELEVTVANEQLQTVKVKAGTARVIVLGQMPVTLSAGEVWRASVITADLTPRSGTGTVAPARAADEATPSALSATAPTTPTTPPTNAPTTSPARTPAIAATSSSPPQPRPAAATPPSPQVTTPRTPAIAATASSPPQPRPASPQVTTPRTPAIAATSSPTTGSVTTTQSGRTPASATPPATPTVAEPVIEPPKPASIEQRFQRGFALLKAGKAQQAADELGAAADASPTSPLAADARYFQAVALVRANDPRAAERVLVQFLDAAPTSLRRGRAAILLGRLLAERGDPKTARAWLETAASDPDPAIAAAAKAGLQGLPKP